MRGTFYAGVSTFERSNGRYPSILRMFSHIVEHEYIIGDENISLLKQKMFCKANFHTCQSIPKEMFIILVI